MSIQLTLPEKFIIERMIHQDYTFASIARHLECSVSIFKHFFKSPEDIFSATCLFAYILFYNAIISCRNFNYHLQYANYRVYATLL